MSYAPNYTPTVGFATEETNSVAGRSTVRTVAVDNELANISTSINGLNTNLKKLQRDDGKPADFLIEPYALSEQTRALITAGGNPRGYWAAATAYVVGDCVQYINVPYLCHTAHTSSSGFDSGLWMAISGDGSSFASAAAAAASATAAASSQTSAASSASSASASATSATNSATSATNSATSASNSAAAAAASATSGANPTGITSINGGQLAGLRNRLINGRGGICQRGVQSLTSASAYASAVYGDDRWKFFISGGTAIGASTTANADYLGIASGTGWTTGKATMLQCIEKKNCYGLNSKTVTVSGKFFQNAGTGARTINVELWKPTTTADDFSTQTQVDTSKTFSAADGSETTFSVSFTIGASDATNGLALRFQEQTAASVGASKTFYAKDVQLEIGSTATPFEQRPYGMELALCQRYYRRYTGANYTLMSGTGMAYDTTHILVPDLPNGVEWRVVPTASYSGAIAANDGNSRVAITALSTRGNESTTKCALYVATVAAGLTQFRPYYLSADNNTSQYFEASAEL